MKKNYLFVYGTLLAGECNHHVLGDSICIQENGWVYGRLYDTRQGFPVLELDASTHEKVRGELYEISAEQLLEVDRLEGYEQPGESNLYDRVNVKVFFSDSEQVMEDVIVYSNIFYPTTADRWIQTGDWRRYRQGLEVLPVVFQETWERAVSQQDRALFDQLNKQQPPLRDKVRLLPVRTGFNHEGRCFATVLIQNATGQELDFSKADLNYKRGEKELLSQTFLIPQLKVAPHTSTPWTFLFDDQQGIRDQVEQGVLRLDQWEINLLSLFSSYNPHDIIDHSHSKSQ